MTSVAALLARSELLAGHRPSGPDTPVTPSYPHEHAGDPVGVTFSDIGLEF